MIPRLRALVDTMTAEHLGGCGAGALALVALVVPFGWVALLLRWAPIRRVVHTARRRG